MISISYRFDSTRARYIVEGTRVMSNGTTVTRMFESFKTQQGAENYCKKYEEKQAKFYKKGR